ncbi:MAG: hypothetical protein AAFW00_24630 [Bacteroidota bacterium]
MSQKNVKGKYPQLEKLYLSQTDHQLHQLKQAFLSEYERAGELSDFYLRRRILELEAIIFPPFCMSQAKGVARELGISIQEFQKLTQGIQDILEGKPSQYLKKRSIADLEQPSCNSWIAPWVIFDFLRWLREGDFTPMSIDTHTPITWMDPSKEKGITLLYHELVKVEAIAGQTELADFQHLFTPQPSIPVIWQKSERLLYHLFQELSQAQFILPYTQAQLTQKLAEHFIRPHNKPIKAKHLASNISTRYRPPRGHQIVTFIIQKLKDIR